MAVDNSCILKELLGDGWEHFFLGAVGGGGGGALGRLDGKKSPDFRSPDRGGHL